MKASLALILCAAVHCSFFLLASADTPQLDEGVLVLTDDIFDNEISKHALIMVEFYAPWCGHCKKLAPEYAKAAKKLAGRVPLAKVDATENAKSAGKFSVKGYPTLFVISNYGENVINYEGGRTTEDMVNFLERQLQPAVSEISVTRELNEIIKEEQIAVVAFLLDAASSEFKSFTEIAKSLKNEIRFASVEDSDIASKFKVETPTIVAFKKFDEGRVELDPSSKSLAELREWVTGQAIPLLDAIGPENYKKYVDRGLPIGYVFIDPEKTKQVDAYKAIGTAVSAKFRGKMLFATADGVKYAGHAKNLGLSGNKPWGFAAEDSTGNHFIYPEDEEFVESKLEALVAGILDGTVTPYLKSEPIPEASDEPVKTIVGNSFKSVVLDPTKDVFIEFYAPWCGHCKKLAPIWDELAEKFKPISSVVIAKMDSTANDAPGVKIQGFPTLKFYPANNKAGIPYEGGRTLDDFSKFILENASVSIDESLLSKTAAADKDEL